MAVKQIELSLKLSIEVDQALLDKLTQGLAEQYVRMIVEELNRDGADVDRTSYRISYGKG
ncbi:hypothetical protein [Spirosoma endbachense]|uniref:Uncharacterized protein n=1 Tax=Spirosoma endbachense TaxID=2666025 RepID=A0A6P1W4C4_9BACT|nr:hypothetical protein [Spirosoma endbachense]QHV94577.1 hypothetical protein GJR95_05900 [Spirosoma endbachense]QHV99418.1 hypothetical protein GJR95_32350 [Spirosoma endbachense]